MSIDNVTIDPRVQTDAVAVMQHVVHKAALDPDVYKRVRERAAAVTERIRQTQDILNLAVDLIRHARDEE